MRFSAPYLQGENDRDRNERISTSWATLCLLAVAACTIPSSPGPLGSGFT